ncbi:MAG TPA: hypothetical protein VFA00_02590 [Actinomycetota bacterium]|nr:hypothetical protein [Actinomycetota bacterium]
MELSSLVADIEGHQRKIVMSAVRPARSAHGADGIPIRGGRTLPFVVKRAWNAPAGNWPEAWYLVDPSTREVLFEGPQKIVSVWGLLAWTEFSDEVNERIPLQPGAYWIVFALGGVQGGQIDVEAFEAAAEG